MSEISPNMNPSQFRFVTYNVETLGEEMDKPGVVSSVNKEKQKEVAETLKEINADVVVMQEVPSEQTLDSFVNENLSEEYPHKQFFKTNDEWNHQMAILSKHPIQEARSNKDRPLQAMPIKHELYLGNLNHNTDEKKLNEMLSKYGDIKSIAFKDGSQKGLPTNFAFVEMTSDEAVKAAIKDLDGMEIDGNALKVSESKQNNRPAKFLRDVIEAQIDLGGFPLKVYGVHYKANPYFARPTTPEKIELAHKTREAEAQETLNIIAEDMKSTPSMRYIVAGDMNTTSEDKAITILKNNGSTPLVDPLENKTGQEFISHPVTGNRLDYAMVSPDLATGVTDAKVHHSEHADKASDHLPVVLTFDLGSIKENTV